MSFMRRIAFVVGILGLGALVGFLLKEPVMIESLDGLKIEDIVQIEGIVEEERKFGNGKLLIVDEMPVFCECSGSYAGLRVSVSGIIEKFPEDLRIRAFIVRIAD